MDRKGLSASGRVLERVLFVETAVDVLPHVNATLNAVAALLLLRGYRLLKRGRERAHIRTMLSCFGVSVLFLICYLVYHQLLFTVTGQRGKPFTNQVWPIRQVYFAILISHVLLAVTVPFLAGITIYHGLRNQRKTHRRWARWTFPIWLYVSLTGVVVYLMLYHLFAAESVPL